MDAAASHFEIEIAHSGEAAERLGDTAKGQDRIARVDVLQQRGLTRRDMHGAAMAHLPKPGQPPSFKGRKARSPGTVATVFKRSH